MIPFFVADRPMSLRLLKGLSLQDYPGVSIGVMAHANTTLNFQQAFRQYPCDDLDYCDATGGSCLYRDDISQCSVRRHILGHTVKMCDSGIFTREGATLTYNQLFETYSRMGVEYGVMIDVFLDPQATLRSAEQALQAYEPFRGNFNLVGVAQGDRAEDYLDCYAQLRQLGFDYIAVGGLLRRRSGTVRFVNVRSEDFMLQVLRELHQRYPNDWLFALGCFHPSRLLALEDLNVWADYKGWIFQYEKRNETLDAYLEELASNHLGHLDERETFDEVSVLRRIIALRNTVVARQERLSQQLVDGRRALRSELSSLHQGLQRKAPGIATRFKGLTTHGLLDDTEEKLVRQTLQLLGREGTEEADRVLHDVGVNRELKKRTTGAEERIDSINALVAGKIIQLTSNRVGFSEETRRLCARIVDVIRRTEREHRFEQVRTKIAEDILALL